MDPSPTYTFFAVGKGNMTLVEFPNGVTMLVDCRRSDSHPSPLQYLSSKGITSLDFIVITHPHQDHITGLEELCDALKPQFFWNNGRYFRPDPVYDDWSFYEKIRSGSVSYCESVTVHAGQTATIGSTKLLVSGPCVPQLEGTSEDENNNCIVLTIAANKSKVILTGDTEKAQWDKVDLRPLSSASIFLASHHGREDGFSEDVVRAVSPQRIVISDGAPGPTDATDKYRALAPVSTTRNNSVVVRPQH